jgi:hypothetical protein
MFADKAEAYPSETLFRYSSLGWAPGLTHRHQTRLEKLAGDKYSSLLRKIINYGQKSFITFGQDGVLHFQTHQQIHGEIHQRFSSSGQTGKSIFWKTG